LDATDASQNQNKHRFIPSTEWPEVPDGAILPNGGEYRMNMETGKNRVRWSEPVPSPNAVQWKEPEIRTDRHRTEPPVAEAQSTKESAWIQPLSDKRVQQIEDGSWTRLTDPNVSQEKSVQCGAIYESDKAQYWITSGEDNWIKSNESAVKNYLNISRGIPTKAPKGADGEPCGPNPMNMAMNFIRDAQTWTTPLRSRDTRRESISSTESGSL
jgi:hypothetical protein